MTRSRDLKLITFVGLGIFLIDRVSKWWIVEVMDLARLGRIEVWPPFLNLTMAWNTGINFGLGAGGGDTMRWILIAVALTICAVLVWWVLARAKSHIAIPVGIVIGGALGNAWDRVQYAAVADFLNMSCCGIQNPYAFNVADVAIFLGAVLIALRA